MKSSGWRILRSSYAIDTPYLRLRKDTVELPTGSIVDDYYVRESRGFVIVFALTPAGEVVLVRQYKHGIGKEVLELPAGAIDAGESPLDTAIRELAEETGHTAASYESLGSFVVEPTNSDVLAYLFLARGAQKTREQSLDITENIAVESVSISRVRALLRDGTIDCMPHIAAIYLVLERFSL